MLRLATVGTSMITDLFLNACKKTERYIFEACYSRSAVKAADYAQKHGFQKFYFNLENVAKDPDVDVVYIASPNALHYQQSKLFLEHGKHVICEKPIATSASRYLELLEFADRKHLIYMEAIMSRHSEGRNVILDAIKQIGTIRMARFDYCQRSSRYDKAMAGEYTNIFDMSLAAGTLMDLGIYCVYGALDLLGDPLDIKASAAYLPNGADIAGAAVFTYPGFLATLSYSKAGNGVAGTEIIGDQGTVQIGCVSQYLDVCLTMNGKKTQLIGTQAHTLSMCGEANKFADYVERRDGTDYLEICALSHKVHQCMDMIKRSAGIEYC